MKRKTIIILFLLALFVLVIALWPSDDNGSKKGDDIEFVGEEGEEEKKLPPEIKEMTQYVYEPVTINVQQNTTFQEAFYVENTYNIQQVEESKNIGGTKLIAEMSADVDGMPQSRSSNGDCTINIYPLNVLKLHIEENTKKTTNVFWRLHNTTISMISSVVSIQQTVNTDGSLLELLGDFIQALLTGCKMEVNLILINNTSKTITCDIPQGQMLETEAENAQNLVVSEAINFIIKAKQQIEVTVPVYCAAHKRGSPVDSKVRFTPYVLNAPSSVYKSQQDVWNYIEAPAKNRIVFYCWRKGDIASPGGQLSKTGHAFVKIPDIGYRGFGPQGLKAALKKIKIYVKGNLSDHEELVPYATDSCVCYITDMQLEKVKAKYYEWQNNTDNNKQHYTVGLYDCTTFAMDIADAAEIYYGWRTEIQTPAFFMEQMKKYNQPKR